MSRDATPEQSDSYAIRVKCGNCSDENRILIPLGQAIKDTACPTCGCAALAKAFMATGHRS